MNVIEVNNLGFTWKGQDSETLSISSLAVKAGEKVFLKGASGSGKSTLLSLVAGINIPSRGDIKVLGVSQSSLKPSKRDRFRADHIGYVFQMFNLLPYLSVIDNILLPCKFSKARGRKAGVLIEEATRLAKALNLSDEIIQKPVHSLSIGQQQRVAAARALIGKPELIIADEPTSALDTENREDFIKLLMTECENAGSTLLFVSHDPTLEYLFDRCVTLTELNEVTEK